MSTRRVTFSEIHWAEDDDPQAVGIPVEKLEEMMANFETVRLVIDGVKYVVVAAIIESNLTRVRLQIVSTGTAPGSRHTPNGA